MGKYIRLGLGILGGVAAGLAVYGYIRARRETHEEKLSYAEAAESGEA